MNLKELIEEILANSFMYEMSPAKKIAQATTDILKAIELADKTIEKIWDRVNGSDADERTYWRVLKIIEDYREKRG